MRYLYRRVGDEPITNINNQASGECQSITIETPTFSSEVHVLADTLRPCCVDQHLVVRQLRGVARTSSSLGHRKNLPTSEVTQ